MTSSWLRKLTWSSAKFPLNPVQTEWIRIKASRLQTWKLLSWESAALLWSGNYTQALDDFQECLKLQEKHLDADSRLLAETHYQLGLTHSLNLQHSQAVAELNRSISVIKTRLGEEARSLTRISVIYSPPRQRVYTLPQQTSCRSW